MRRRQRHPYTSFQGSKSIDKVSATTKLYMGGGVTGSKEGGTGSKRGGISSKRMGG